MPRAPPPPPPLPPPGLEGPAQAPTPAALKQVKLADAIKAVENQVPQNALQEFLRPAKSKAKAKPKVAREPRKLGGGLPMGPPTLATDDIKNEWCCYASIGVA